MVPGIGPGSALSWPAPPAWTVFPAAAFEQTQMAPIPGLLQLVTLGWFIRLVPNSDGIRRGANF